KPLLKDVQKLTKPFQPYLDALTEKIGVLSDLVNQKVTLIDLAAHAGIVPKDVASLIHLVEDVTVLAGKIDTLSAALAPVTVDLAFFHLDGPGVDLRALDPVAAMNAFGTNLTNLIPQGAQGTTLDQIRNQVLADPGVAGDEDLKAAVGAIFDAFDPN